MPPERLVGRTEPLLVLQCDFVSYPVEGSARRRRQWLRQAVAWRCLRQFDQCVGLCGDVVGGVGKALSRRWIGRPLRSSVMN